MFFNALASALAPSIPTVFPRKLKQEQIFHLKQGPSCTTVALNDLYSVSKLFVAAVSLRPLLHKLYLLCQGDPLEAML